MDAIVPCSSTHLGSTHFIDVLHSKNRPDPFEGYHPLPSLTQSLIFKRRGCALYSDPPFHLAIMAAAQCTKRTRLSISSSYVTNNVYMCQLSSLAAYTRSYLFSYFFLFFFLFSFFLFLPSSLVRRCIVCQSESIQHPNNIFIGY